MNDEDHVLLSEKLEDQLKAVEWAHEQKKILDDKSRRIADALMEKISQYRSFVILPTVSADNGPRLLISAVLP